MIPCFLLGDEEQALLTRDGIWGAVDAGWDGAAFMQGGDAPEMSEAKGEGLALVAAPLVHAIQTFEAQGFAPFQHAFNTRDALAGVPVGMSDGVQGIAKGVDASGALLLHTAQGVQRVTTSEVSVRRVT